MIDTRDEWLEQRGKAVNDAGSAREALRELMLAKQEGIGVAILAHTTKGDQGSLEDLIAGSGQWGAGVDWIVGLRRDPNADQGSNQREIECNGRMGIRANIPKSLIEMDIETGEYTWLGEKESVAASETIRDLAEVVDPGREYRLAELAKFAGVPSENLRMAIKRDKTETFVWVKKGVYRLSTDASEPNVT